MSEGICTITVERMGPIEPRGRITDWQEVPVEIVYEYWAEEKPAQWYPGRPATVEIQSTSIPLTTDEEQRAEQACWEDVRKRQKEAKEP